MFCIVDCIRARNGRFHRMYCTLDTDTSLFSGDAQIARTTYSNSCTLSYLFGAILIHNERKPSRVRSDDDSIQISLNSICLRSGLAWTSAARPLLTYAAALLGPPLPGPYLRTYYVDACTAVPGCFKSIRYVFLFLNPNSWPRIFKGRN